MTSLEYNMVFSFISEVELLPVWYNVSSPMVVWDFDLSLEKRDLLMDTSSRCFVDNESVERSNISLSRNGGSTLKEKSLNGLNWKKPFVNSNEDVNVCHSKGLEYVRNISKSTSIHEIPKEGFRNYLNEEENSNQILNPSLDKEDYEDNIPSDANIPLENSSCTVDCDKEISLSEFKLPASKCPIMEATAFCAIKNWGISVAVSSPNEVVFSVTDFDQYYKISRSICSKQHPTEDIGSRVKSLRRWFSSFPKKKERKEHPHFELTVKPSGARKVNEMIEKNLRLLGIQKLRRKL